MFTFVLYGSPLKTKVVKARGIGMWQPVKKWACRGAFFCPNTEFCHSEKILKSLLSIDQYYVVGFFYVPYLQKQM